MAIDLNKERMRRKGEPMFIQCECGSTDFAISCIHGNGKAIINAIVCTGCADDCTIIYGELRL